MSINTLPEPMFGDMDDVRERSSRICFDKPCACLASHAKGQSDASSNAAHTGAMQAALRALRVLRVLFRHIAKPNLNFITYISYSPSASGEF